jgi:transposase
VGTGEAYDRGRDFAAWLGLVPRQHSTGGRTILGRITKRGSRYQRWSRNFGPVVKVDRMKKVTIQNEETKEPFARIQS